MHTLRLARPPYEKPPRGPLGTSVIVQGDPEWILWRFENDDWDDLNDQDPLVMALHEEIRAWGERWNLSWGKRRKLWLLDVALLSLRLWHQGHPWEPEYPFFLEDPFVKGRFADPRFVDTDDKAELVLPAWHPMWEPWSTYEKKVQRKLAKYRLKREAWAKSQGMKPGTKKRGDVDKHFEWLAHHQVLEKSYETIAKEFRVKQNAVAKAVRKTAKLIGLKLREVGPGMRNK